MSKTVLASCLYPGPHSDLYAINKEFLIDTHKNYCAENNYDYACHDEELLTSNDLKGELTDEQIKFTTQGVMFGTYKWILTWYYTQIKNYDCAVSIDYDTRFFRTTPLPEEIYNVDIGVSCEHAWSHINSSPTFFWLTWLNLRNNVELEYWYNTGLFSVTKKFDYMDFLREFINETMRIFYKETMFGKNQFSMNLYTDVDHHAIFKSNHEIFLQCLIKNQNLNPSIYVYDWKWNSGLEKSETIHRHYTDKHRLPNQLSQGN